MIKTTSKKTEVDVLEDVICDVCGNSCKNSTNIEYMTLKNYWGYGSNKDGEIWEAHVCEKCVDEKFQFIKFRKERLMELYAGSRVKNSSFNLSVIGSLPLTRFDLEKAFLAGIDGKDFEEWYQANYR